MITVFLHHTLKKGCDSINLPLQLFHTFAALLVTLKGCVITNLRIINGASHIKVTYGFAI